MSWKISQTMKRN